MKKGTVTSEKIHFSRSSRATDAEIKALAEDIRDTGLKHPILVDAHSGLLIDGLKRFRANQMLGWSVVPAYFAEDHTQAADYLQALRGVLGEPFDYLRITELYQDFRSLAAEVKVGRRTGVARGVKLPHMEGCRTACSRASGVSENSISRINRLMSLAGSGNEEAAQILENLWVSAPGSPINGFSRAAVLYKANQRMLPMENEQRVEAISNVLRAAETALEQAVRIGGLHLLSIEDAEKIDFRVSELIRQARALTKELKRRNR